MTLGPINKKGTGGGGGDITTAVNVGGGEELFKQKNVDVLEFRTLVSGDGVTVTQVGDTIEIAATNDGTITGASNVGGGEELFKQDNAGVLEFRTLVGVDDVEINEVGDTIEVGAPQIANLFLLTDSLFDAVGQLQSDIPVLEGEIAALTAAAVTNASNIGGGTYGLFASKSGNTLQFKTINQGTNGISLSEAGNVITVDLTQDLKVTASPTFANLNISNLGAIRPAALAGNVLFLQARDVDGASWTTFISLTSNNNPTCDLDESVTKSGNYIYRAGGTDVGLIDGGTGASLSDPNNDRIMFWDDSAGQVTWLAPSGGLVITGTTISGQSGTYTPTFTNVANVASFGTVSDATWSRTGDAITVSGRVGIDPTSASISTQFRMSLPVASNFTLFTDVGGTCASKDSASIAIAICADTVNDQANFQYINTTETAAKEFSYIYQYIVK